MRTSGLAILGVIKLAALGGIVLGLIQLQRQQSDAAELVGHTMRVLAKATALEADVAVAVSDRRGFHISLDAADAASSQAAVTRAKSDLDDLARLTVYDDGLPALIAPLAAHLDARLAFLHRLADVGISPPPAVIQASRLASAGLADALTQLRMAEEKLLAERQDRLSRAVTATWAGLFICSVIVVTGIMLTALLFAGRRHERRDAAALARRHAELEASFAAQTEAQQRAAERESAFFQHSTDGLVVLAVTDAGAGQPPGIVYERVSPSYARMFGLSEAALIGQGPESWMPPQMRARVMAQYRACIEAGEVHRFSGGDQLPGGYVDVECVLTPIHDGDGRVVRLVNLLRDVTDRTRMEAALRQGQKMEAIGRIAAGVAHDFNNILQAVTAGLDLVLDDLTPGERAHEFATVALNAATRGASLTHHLLAYARKEILRPGHLETADFLAEFRIMLARLLPPNISVALDLDPATPPLFVDAGLLQTALLNLATNAADAMPKGGTLTLESSLGASAGAPCGVLAVSDTGTGMSPDTLAQATEPFFSTKGQEGCGLGLSMVHGFVAQSDGELKISSIAGIGTRIELRLPASIGAAPSRPVGPPPGALIARVLLVDDVADVLATGAALLARGGVDVVSAIDGEAALSALRDGGIDALVCDFAMPGLSGIDLILAARRLHPDLPALMVSGYANVETDTSLPPDVPVLQKPVTGARLLEGLRQVLGLVVV